LETRPDDQGIVHFTDRVPGIYEVHARLKGRSREVRTVELKPGQILDLGTITFGNKTLVRGRCVDGEGHPRRVNAGLFQIADDASSTVGRTHVIYRITMDEQGLFSITGLPAGRFLIRLAPLMPGMPGEVGEAGWEMDPALVDTRNGPIENLVIVVHRPVTATLHPTSTEVGGMKFAVIATDGLEYRTGEFGGSAAVALELVPGVYTLRLTRDHVLVREIPFTVGSSPVTIDVGP
jgi:hypothetical protein